MTRARVVLVVGTGRSGTSTLSRLLHVNLGIPMAMPVPGRFPGQFWEDPAFKAFTRPLFFNDATSSSWEERAGDYIRGRLKAHGEKPWGLKLPQLAWTLWPFCRLLQDLAAPDSAVFMVEARRPIWDVAASAEKRGHIRPMRRALEELTLRDYALRRNLEDCRALRIEHVHKAIDFSERVPEPDLLEQLAGFIPLRWLEEGQRRG